MDGLVCHHGLWKARGFFFRKREFFMSVDELVKTTKTKGPARRGIVRLKDGRIQA